MSHRASLCSNCLVVSLQGIERKKKNLPLFIDGLDNQTLWQKNKGKSTLPFQEKRRVTDFCLIFRCIGFPVAPHRRGFGETGNVTFLLGIEVFDLILFRFCHTFLSLNGKFYPHLAYVLYLFCPFH